jgi:hypothetical protein
MVVRFLLLIICLVNFAGATNVKDDLSDLQEYVSNKIKQRNINTTALPQHYTLNDIDKAFFKQTGYQLIHHLIIDINNDNEDDNDSYYGLIEKLLKAGCDPDAYSKHKQTPLFCAVDDNNGRLFNLLIRYKANPNVLVEQGTPLLAALIERTGEEADHLVYKLFHLTGITPQIQAFFKDSIPTYVASNRFEVINRLLDFKLDFIPRVIKDPGILPDGMYKFFKEGFWIRTIKDVSYENEILNKRENITDEALAMLGHSTDSKDKGYTKYSPATFVKKDIPIRLFGTDVGLIIKAHDRIIDHWYDGLNGEKLTREGDSDLDWSKSELDNGSSENHQLWKVKETIISQRLSKIFDERLEKEYFKAVKQDRYNILKDEKLRKKLVYDFAWNEGLFRYKRNEIIGIYVPNSVFITKGLELRSSLGLNNDIRLFHYESGQMWITKSEK